jgi:hypothetical protein
MKNYFHTQKTIILSIVICLSTAMSSFGQTATYDPGIVINGVTWATRNVDAPDTFATTPEDAGMFYQWGKNIGWTTTDPMVNSNNGTTWDNTMATGMTNPVSENWAENQPCPLVWRVAHSANFSTLLDESKVENEWIIQNGVTGRKFTDKANKNTVFFPASGYRDKDNGALTQEVGKYNNCGYYFAQDAPLNYPTGSKAFWITETIAEQTAAYRNLGLSIRCVSIFSSSIENVKTDELQIFVNNNELIIQGEWQADNLQIYDIAGRKVGTYNVHPNETINIAHLSSGIYIAKMVNKTVKFVKK